LRRKLRGKRTTTKGVIGKKGETARQQVDFKEKESLIRVMSRGGGDY